MNNYHVTWEGKLIKNTIIDFSNYNTEFDLTGTGDFLIHANNQYALFVNEQALVGVNEPSPIFRFNVTDSLDPAQNTSANASAVSFNYGLTDNDGNNELFIGGYSYMANANAGEDYGYGFYGKSQAEFAGGIGLVGVIANSVYSFALDAAVMGYYRQDYDENSYGGYFFNWNDYDDASLLKYGTFSASVGDYGSKFGIYGAVDYSGVQNFGVYGLVGSNGSLSSGLGSAALYGYNARSDGWGAVITGTASTTLYLSGGAGALCNAEDYAVLGFAHDNQGNGVVGVGNGQTTVSTLTNGSGGAFTGSTIGIYGYAANNTNGTWGGYFANRRGDYALVAGRTTGGTSYKIIGSGNVSTIVNSADKSNKITMFAPEAPEIFFQDYGSGQLTNGKAHIDLDPNFSANITVNEKHPLRVFIQLEGDCKGVFVTNKTSKGFDVIELDGGKSNAKFSWYVVANRADEYDEKGNLISKNVDIRFPPAPLPLKTENIPVREDKNSIQKLPIDKNSGVRKLFFEKNQK